MKLYYVTYVGAVYGSEHPEYVRIALRAVYKEKDERWYSKEHIRKEEQQFINEIFEKEIISRLEKVTKTESYIR